MYDASQRRGWLPPKQSLALNASHAYPLDRGPQDDQVPCVDPYADAIDIVSGLESCDGLAIHQDQTDPLQALLGQELILWV